MLSYICCRAYVLQLQSTVCHTEWHVCHSSFNAGAMAVSKCQMPEMSINGQVGSRAERMGLQGSKHLYLYSATRLVDVLQEVVAMQPRAVVIDSIQTVYLDDVSGSAGSVSQVQPQAQIASGRCTA